MGNDADFYEKDGKRYTRPTHVLDYFAPPELVAWKVKTGLSEANRISRAALKHGSRVDDLIREGAKPKKSDALEVQNCLDAFYKWKDSWGASDLVFPVTAYCEERGIAGTPDFYWPAMKCLIDVKSAKTIHEGYFFQLGCYRSLPLPFPIERVAVLRLDKEIREYEFKTNEHIGMDLDELTDGFNGLLGYYKAYEKVKRALAPKERVYDGSGD